MILTAKPASAAVVSTIIVKGNQRIEAETVRSYLTIKPGKPYSAADIDESIKVLYDTGLFSDVAIRQSGAALVVTVAENPIISSVVFDGNKKVKTETLTQVVSSKPRGTLTDARLRSDVQRIKEYYSRSGRNAAIVDARVTDLPDNRVNVTFIIREGDRTGVGSIVFVGNDAFSTNRLVGVIATRKTNWLSWLNKKDVYSDEKLQADQELLRRFYLQHGYADFQVLSANAQYDDAQGKYYVTYTLDEGPKYTFSDIAIDSSIAGVDSTALMHEVRTKKGDVFNATDVEKSVEDLTIELSRQGYVFAQVRPRGDRDYSNNTIALTYVIDEGPRTYVERIDVRGNTRTRDYVIRREFDLSEGDAFNRVLVDRAERKLRNLGYFKSVNITTEPGSSPDKVIIVVTVEDQSTGSFSISGGVSTSDGLIAEVALEEKNFLGRGQAVKVSVGGGFSTQTYNLSFTDPYFLGTRISAGFDLYHTEADDRGNSSSRPYSSSTTGGSIRFGLPLTEDLNLGLNYKYISSTTAYNSSYSSATCTAGPAPAGGEASCYFPAGTRVTSSAGYSLVYSTIDNTLDPHEGKYLKLSQDFAGIGGNARYMKSTFDARAYAPILPDGDMVGLLRFTGGNVMGLGSQVASADSFLLGGETIRGFDTLGLGPRDANSGVAVGGKNYLAGTAEVSFPLPFMPPDFGLRGAVFADAGTVFGADVPSGCPACSVLDTAAFRSSVGASLIWASPLGLLRADVAQVLTKASYDKTQLFRFGIGTQF